MLDEQQSAAGPQYATQLPQGTRLIVDRAEHQRRYDDVKALVVERQILRRRAQQLRIRLGSLDVLLQSAGHWLCGLGDDEGAHGPVVEGQVCSRAATDLQHVASRGGEQRLPVGAKAIPLALGHKAVIHRGEDTTPNAHPRSSFVAVWYRHDGRRAGAAPHEAFNPSLFRAAIRGGDYG